MNVMTFTTHLLMVAVVTMILCLPSVVLVPPFFNSSTEYAGRWYALVIHNNPTDVITQYQIRDYWYSTMASFGLTVECRDQNFITQDDLDHALVIVLTYSKYGGNPLNSTLFSLINATTHEGAVFVTEAWILRYHNSTWADFLGIYYNKRASVQMDNITYNEQTMDCKTWTPNSWENNTLIDANAFITGNYSGVEYPLFSKVSRGEGYAFYKCFSSCLGYYVEYGRVYSEASWFYPATYEELMTVVDPPFLFRHIPRTGELGIMFRIDDANAQNDTEVWRVKTLCNQLFQDGIVPQLGFTPQPWGDDWVGWEGWKLYNTSVIWDQDPDYLDFFESDVIDYFIHGYTHCSCKPNDTQWEQGVIRTGSEDPLGWAEFYPENAKWAQGLAVNISAWLANHPWFKTRSFIAPMGTIGDYQAPVGERYWLDYYGIDADTWGTFFYPMSWARIGGGLLNNSATYSTWSWLGAGQNEVQEITNTLIENHLIVIPHFTHMSELWNETSETIYTALYNTKLKNPWDYWNTKTDYLNQITWEELSERCKMRFPHVKVTSLQYTSSNLIAAIQSDLKGKVSLDVKLPSGQFIVSVTLDGVERHVWREDGETGHVIVHGVTSGSHTIQINFGLSNPNWHVLFNKYTPIESIVDNSATESTITFARGFNITDELLIYTGDYKTLVGAPYTYHTSNTSITAQPNPYECSRTLKLYGKVSPRRQPSS